MAILQLDSRKTARIDNSREVISNEQIGINSLTCFGHAVNSKAELPVIPHIHKDKLEFVILVSGIQDYNVMEVAYPLYDGDALLIYPREVHSSGKSLCPSNEIIWFQIDVSCEDRFLSLTQGEASVLHKKLIDVKARQFHLTPGLISKLLESFNLIKSTDPIDKLKGHSLFIYSLVSMLDQKSRIKALTEDVNKAKQYIILHITQIIDMDELSIASGISATELKHKFKEQTGMTVREFIKSQKIEKCKPLVGATKESIADIAFEYSFSSTKYFCSLFKQLTGYSPKKYRRQYQKGKIEQ